VQLAPAAPWIFSPHAPWAASFPPTVQLDSFQPVFSVLKDTLTISLPPLPVLHAALVLTTLAHNQLRRALLAALERTVVSEAGINALLAALERTTLTMAAIQARRALLAALERTIVTMAATQAHRAHPAALERTTLTMPALHARPAALERTVVSMAAINALPAALERTILTMAAIQARRALLAALERTILTTAAILALHAPLAAVVLNKAAKLPALASRLIIKTNPVNPSANYAPSPKAWILAPLLAPRRRPPPLTCPAITTCWLPCSRASPCKP
jgi:hypothetical protein